MIFRIENFGPIKAFEMDLSKDMHLLYGKNSVGKSYAVGVLYLFLKHFLELDFSKKGDAYLRYPLKEISIQNLNTKIAISKNIEEYFNNHLHWDSFNKNFNAGLSNSLEIDFVTEDFLIQCKTEYYEVTFNYKNKRFLPQINLFDNWYISKNSDSKFKYIFELYVNATHFYSFTSSDDNSNEEVINKLIAFLFQNSINQVHNIYFLPASRSGLYPLWSSMGSIFAWIAQNRQGVKQSIEIPTLSNSITDYFLNFNNSVNGNYKTFAAQIENKVLDGKVILDRNNSKIFFKSSRLKEQIELPHSGSMVSELSPLVTYLKDIMTIEKKVFETENIFVAEEETVYETKIHNNKKNILIIEEPEAHLHPEAQIELMKIFADMVQNSNIKLILTSHSDYMFAELSNLMLGKKIDYHRVAAYHLVMEEGGSIDAKDMEVSEEGILDYNFVDVSERLYNERMELFEQFNAETDAP